MVLYFRVSNVLLQLNEVFVRALTNTFGYQLTFPCVSNTSKIKSTQLILDSRKFSFAVDCIEAFPIRMTAFRKLIYLSPRTEM